MARIFTLEALPAHKGDCLILHFGTTENRRIAVVDGGPFHVWQPFLRMRLNDIRQARPGGADAPLPIDFVMVSHIDADHIVGILQMAQELKENAELNRRSIATVDVLWHNAFDDIIGNEQISGPNSPLASMQSADFGAEIPPELRGILVSVKQGRDLRGLARALGWRVNPGRDALVMDDGGAPDTTFDGLSVTVLGPGQEALGRLQKSYDRYLRKHDLGRDSAEAALATTRDTSVPNLSSIVALIESEGRSILLTGDAQGDRLEEALEARGLATEGAPLKVDILKLPHHGSIRNVAPSFFRKVKADHYVFCGNGSHGNPDRATLETLFGEQGDDPVSLHFTTAIDRIDAKRREERLGDGEPWDDARDALGTLFAAEQAAGRPFVVIEPLDRTGVRIELGDAIDIPPIDP